MRGSPSCQIDSALGGFRKAAIKSATRVIQIVYGDSSAVLHMNRDVVDTERCL